MKKQKNSSGVDPGVAWLSGLVYFVQGALGLAGVALPLYLRAQEFSIAKITWITALSSAPWFFKILYGALSDAVPIFSLRRKPYLAISCVISCVGWVFLAVLPPQDVWLIGSMMIANLGLAATDVITDGLVVDYSREGSAQIYQSISWGFRSLGALLSGVTGGYLAAKMSPKFIFLIVSILPLIALPAVFLLHEQREARPPKSILSPLLASVRLVFSGDLKWFSLLLIITSSGAVFGTPFFFYLRETLHFEEFFLGLLQSTAWGGAVLGCFLFLMFFQNMPVKRALLWAIGIGSANTLLILLVLGKQSAFLIFLFSGIVDYICFLPFMSSAAKLAHGTGAEGALFAVLMSILNIGKAFAAFAGGILFGWIGLQWLIVFAAFFGLLGLLILPKLKTL